MSDIEGLRATILQETDSLGTRRRFGLFSSPPPVAVGDDGEYKTVIHPRDATGKPVTQLRGVFTNPPRSGQIRTSYFGHINSLASGDIKDEYIDPDRKLLLIQNETFSKGYNKDQMFKPTSGFKETQPVPYQFKEENNPELDPKRNRDPDGKVKSDPRNFYTNQQSTVIRSFFKPIKYMEDPYERAHKMDVQHTKRERSLEGEARFKLNLHPKVTFSKEKQTYGTDVEFSEKKPKDPKFNIYKHENRWKTNNPNKSGLYGYLSPFPPYKENPPKQIGRKPKEEGGKETFRRMSVAQSTPSPSIALHRSNLSRTISHSVSYRR